MSTTANQNAALEFILAQYAAQLDALRPAKEVPGKAPKAPKLSTSHRKLKAPKSEIKLYVPTFAYPTGSVGPEGFFKMLRNAKGQSEEREAINAFCGYSDHEAHGTQIDKARRQAHLALHSHLGHRSAKSTAKGYVAGAVNVAAKQTADLCARERLCAESLCQLQLQLNEVIAKLSAPTLGNQEEDELQSQRNLVFGLIEVERDRLSNIRADLSKLESL
jgi:hypothetical protein